jgi:hypothetical protein
MHDFIYIRMLVLNVTNFWVRVMVFNATLFRVLRVRLMVFNATFNNLSAFNLTTWNHWFSSFLVSSNPSIKEIMTGTTSSGIL